MPPLPGRPWKALHSELLIDTPHMRVRRDRIETARGDVVDDYHVRETRGFVVIFALTPAGDVVLVRQYKYGINHVVIELPGGAIDEGESALEAATRELVEETGYEAPAGLEPLRSFIIDPTNSNGRFVLFLGRDVALTGQRHFDPTEDIAVQLVPLDGLLELVRDGTIDVNFHVASIYTVLDRLGRLS
jgi:ADP-ribose pyrophosphatase